MGKRKLPLSDKDRLFDDFKDGLRSFSYNVAPDVSVLMI